MRSHGRLAHDDPDDGGEPAKCSPRLRLFARGVAVRRAAACCSGIA
ncbi:MAG: hypothetical protein WD969_12320 [Paracoccaceae bacterium]